jgi:hypothetical protein
MPSVEMTANVLGRLLSRLGEPEARVVQSKVLYRAPISAADLMPNLHNLLLIRRLHRAVAIRIVREFRTISTATAAAAVLGYLRLSCSLEVP